MYETDIYHDISYVLPIVEVLIRGYCFYCLVKPFMISNVVSKGMSAAESINVSDMKKKRGVFYVGAVYFLAMLLLYIVPLQMNVYTAYGIGSLITFFFVCLLDRRNYVQKSFLVMLFFSLSRLCSAMAEILYDNLYAFAWNTDYMKIHPAMSIPLYAGVCVFYLMMEFVFTILGIWQVLRVYRNKNTDMEVKELIMLVLPSVIGVMAYIIIQKHRMIYILESGRNRDDYDILILLFYAASVIVVIAVIVLYQKMKAKQEENLRVELLAAQISGIKQHIEQVENLYQNMRSVKHDMKNHILTLERLYEGNKAGEAKAYGKELNKEFDRITGEIKSGNPVTDVILQEFKKETEKKGIFFESKFYYPLEANINVFDISIILDNALQNAIENTEKGKVTIVSYRRNNAYIIEICNSFAGDLQWDTENGLPVTSKEKAEGHGYGVSNIRRVARKYFGDIDITVKDGEFCICIMLMIG